MKIRLAAGAAAVCAAVAIAGCGQGEPAGEAASDGIRVVASTNVWGSVATAVGGDLVDVSSIVSDPAGDPHSYQLTPKDTAAMTGADLLVFNGGGYDDFVAQALGEGGEGPQVVEAFALAEPQAREGDNEHVWYQFSTVAAVADEIAKRLGELRPESTDAFKANAKSFQGKLDGLSTRLDKVAQASGGAKVAATEPLAHYLLEDAGLEDVTPAEFVEAIEEETDPPAAAVAQIQDMVAQRQVSLLVHNPQTETPVVADVLTKAREAQLPVVDMTETLPAGQDYVTWMTGQIEALSSALNQT